MYALNVVMLQNTPKRLYLCLFILFRKFQLLEKLNTMATTFLGPFLYYGDLAAILDDVKGPPARPYPIMCTLLSRSRPALSSKPKMVQEMSNMTKTQDGVPQTHTCNGIIKLPRFHVEKSRDTVCHVLSLIMSRLAFVSSFVVCDMHMTKIFMILNHSLVFMVSF